MFIPKFVAKIVRLPFHTFFLLYMSKWRNSSLNLHTVKKIMKSVDFDVTLALRLLKNVEHFLSTSLELHRIVIGRGKRRKETV